VIHLHCPNPHVNQGVIFFARQTSATLCNSSKQSCIDNSSLVPTLSPNHSVYQVRHFTPISFSLQSHTLRHGNTSLDSLLSMKQVLITCYCVLLNCKRMFDFSLHFTSKTVNDFASTVQYPAGHGDHTSFGLDDRKKH